MPLSFLVPDDVLAADRQAQLTDHVQQLLTDGAPTPVAAMPVTATVDPDQEALRSHVDQLLSGSQTVTPTSPLPTDFFTGTPAPNAPVTAPLIAPPDTTSPGQQPDVPPLPSADAGGSSAVADVSSPPSVASATSSGPAIGLRIDDPSGQTQSLMPPSPMPNNGSNYGQVGEPSTNGVGTSGTSATGIVPPSTPIGFDAATVTTAGMSGGVDNPLGDPNQIKRHLLRVGGQLAAPFGGDAARAVQATLVTEGGMLGAAGDSGHSFGPLQFYDGGQLAEFARQHGMSQYQAGRYVQDHPEEAIAWALGTPDRPGYLGAALQRGLARGLSGADLATYIQRTGQVSESPERAGANYNALFGAGAGPVTEPATGPIATRPGSDRTAPGDVGSGVTVPNQFGIGLSQADAAAFCGPVAAMALAARYGNGNIPLDAVRQAAVESGWTPQNGMAGVASEQKLAEKLGVKTRLEQNVDWSNVQHDAQNGNPVVISTPAHYFVIDAYDPKTGSYHVGQSGLALRGGSDWMTPEQMSAQSQRIAGAGGFSGALYVDNPNASGPSVAERTPQQNAPQQNAPASDDLGQHVLGLLGNGLSAIGQAKDTAIQTLGDVRDQAAGAIKSATDAAGGALPQLDIPQPAPGSPLARSINGEQLSPTEQLQAGVQTFQGAETGRQQAVHALNPVKDVPVLGGAVDMAATTASDPLTWVAGGPIRSAAETAVARAGLDGAPAVLRDAATRAAEGAGWGAMQGAEQQNATPQSIAQSAAEGAVLNAGIGLGAAGAGAALNRGLQTLDRLAPPQVARAASTFNPGDVVYNASGTPLSVVRNAGDGTLVVRNELGHELTVDQSAVSPKTASANGQAQTPPALEQAGTTETPTPSQAPAEAGSQASNSATRRISDRESNFLRTEILSTADDPRPRGWSDPGLPNVKSVIQQNLAEVTPDGAVLYHQTSVPSARAIIQRVEAGPRSQDVWVADNRDLALGQAGKGVTLELDPSLVNGVQNSNPTKAFSSAAGLGSEYHVDKSLPGAVTAIVAAGDRQVAQLARDPLLSKRFDFGAAQQTPDGIRIPYRARATAQPAQSASAAVPSAAASQALPASDAAVRGQTLYHGTSTPFETFDVSKTGSNKDAGLFGRGAYLAQQPEVAAKYGPHVMPVQTSVSPDQLYQWPADAGNVRTESLGTKPLPADIRRDVLRHYQDLVPPGFESVDGQMHEPSLAQAVTDVLQERGYKGVAYDNPYAKQPQPEAVLFNPSDMRVRTTTTGAAPASAPPASDGLSFVDPLQATPEAIAAAQRAVPQLPKTPPLPEGARPIDYPPGPGEVARLRLDKFPADVRDAIESAADANDFFPDQRRGVIPDAAAQRMAERYAQDTTLDQVIKGGKAGQAYNTEETRALRNAVAAQAVKVNDAAAAIRAGDGSSEALAGFYTEGLRLDRLMQVAEGARAEAGRALRAYQDPARLVNLSPAEAVTQISKGLGGNRQRLLDLVQQYQRMVDSGANPVQLATFWAKVKQAPPTGWDWFKATRYNSMISGVPTIERIATSGVLESLYGLAREAALNPREIPAAAEGTVLGLAKGGSTFLQTLAHGITEDAAAQGGLPRGLAARLPQDQPGGGLVGAFNRTPVAKPVATALEMPGRIHQAVQDITQQTAYSMRLYSRAAAQASREGLSGADKATRITDLVQAPTDSMSKDAMAFSQRAAMRGDLGTVGSWLNKMPDGVRNFVLPFLRVAYNVSARGIDRSPLGAVGTLVDVARTGGKYLTAEQGDMQRIGLSDAVRPFRERAVDNVVGGLAFAGFYSLATQGLITGAGPTDSARRDQLEATGWQPYSVRIGDRYLPYVVLGPWALPMGMAAAVAEAGLYHSAGEPTQMQVLDGVRRAGELLTHETYLADIGNAYRAMTQPDRYGATWLDDYAQSLVPYGALANNIAQSTDSEVRNPAQGDIPARIQSRIPGLTGNVPPALDALGRPKPNDRQGLGAFLPTTPSPVRNDEVLRALDEAGVTIPAPSKTAANKSGTAIVRLTPDEQRQLHTSTGQLIDQHVRGVISSSDFQKLNATGRARALQRAVTVAAEQAQNALVGTLPADRREPAHQLRLAVQSKDKVPLPVPGD